MTKITFTKAKKIAMKFFGSEMTPLPPFGNFPKIHPFWCGQASLSVVTTHETSWAGTYQIGVMTIMLILLLCKNNHPLPFFEKTKLFPLIFC